MRRICDISCMSRSAKFTERQISTAKALLQQANTAEDIRTAQAILLPVVHGLTMDEAGIAMGVSRATVGRLQQRIRQARGKPGVGSGVLAGEGRGWGGRRNSHMTPEEEAEFLAPWAAEAETAGMIVMGPIRAALAQRLGRPVRASVVWRLLARHGWRKVAPDTRHPKADYAVQAAWKKNSRRHWFPPSGSTIPRIVPCA